MCAIRNLWSLVVDLSLRTLRADINLAGCCFVTGARVCVHASVCLEERYGELFYATQNMVCDVSHIVREFMCGDVAQRCASAAVGPRCDALTCICCLKSLRVRQKE